MRGRERVLLYTPVACPLDADVSRRVDGRRHERRGCRPSATLELAADDRRRRAATSGPYGVRRQRRRSFGAVSRTGGDEEVDVISTLAGRCRHGATDLRVSGE